MNFPTKPLFALVVAVMIPASGSAAQEDILKSEYEKIVEERNQAPVFGARKMDEKDAEFLEAVKANWEVQSSECPDPAFAKIAGLTGVSEDVEGVVAFHAHETPPYSDEDPARNAREAVFAAALTVSLPISVDNMIHSRKGVAYIKNSKEMVTVFEDTKKGLKRTIYVKPAGPDQVAGGEA